MLPSPGAVVAVVVIVIAAIVCGRVPLLSNPGPEAGLVLAVVGGLAIVFAGAVRGARRGRAGFFADWRSGVIVGVIGVVVFLVATAIGQAVSPSCSPNAGRWPMVIVAVPVLLVHAALGPLIGRTVGRRLAAVVVTVLVLAGSLALLAMQLLDEPGFRAASHLFVVVSGDLLQGAALPEAAIGYRAATALLAVVLALVGCALWPAEKTRGLVSGAASESAPLWAAAVVVGIVFVIAHRQATASLIPGRAAMEAAYALTKKRGQLVVHANPLIVTPRDVDAVLAEGTLWLDRLRARLGPLSDDDIHLWLHGDRVEQAKWTGASHVDFALPWRRELHIASMGVPHRSLGHELAHVVAGEKSNTFLKVPARFIVLHNAAVTEGLAMALTPELVVDDGLTLREQAAAMRQAGKAPDLATLFSLSRFFGEEPGRAYVAAGALIESIVADAGDDGPAAIGRLYQGAGRLDAAAGDDEAALLARHEAALLALPLPADAAGFAASRFRRGSILDEICDPDVAAAGEALRAQARNGDVAGAIAGVTRLAGAEADGSFTDLFAEVRVAGDVAGGITLLNTLVELAPSPAERALRGLALGSEQWKAGLEREALSTWNALPLEAAPVDAQRQIVATRAFADVAVRLQHEAVVSRAALAFFVADSHTRDGARAAFAEAIGRAAVDFVRTSSSPAEAVPVVVDGAVPAVVDPNAASVPPPTPPPATPTRVGWQVRSTSPEPVEVLATALYVHARNLVVQGALPEASMVLRPLVEGQLLSATFHDQAVQALAAAAVRWASRALVVDDVDRAALEGVREQLLVAADNVTRPASRLRLRDRAERVARAAAAPVPPALVTTTSPPEWADRLLLGAWPDGAF
ncbi:MAG TPA: hypothetical protein VGF99_21570 [Myxococcota bacterium]